MKKSTKRPFKPMPFIGELFLKKPQMLKYYADKREYLFRQGRILKGMGWRKKIHKLMIALLRLNRVLIERQQIVVLDRNSHSEKPLPQGQRIFGEVQEPVIFTVTHVGSWDYPVMSEALKVHQYPFAGDPETMYRSFEGLLFWLNGVVVCDTEMKSDRKVAKATAVEVLKSGMNMLIYPEGVWNITPNLLVLPLFFGAVDMSQETERPIVPIAVEQYGKTFVINCGQAVKFDNVDRKEATEQLRDILATLKWEIIESRGVMSRAEIGDYETARKEFVNMRLNEWVDPKTKRPWYTEEIVEGRIYRNAPMCCSSRRASPEVRQ